MRDFFYEGNEGVKKFLVACGRQNKIKTSYT